MSSPRTFVMSLAKSSEKAYQELYSELPKVFYQQAKNGAEQFYLDTELVSNNEFRKMGAADPDFFRIYIINPKYDAESGGVLVQFQLNGLIDLKNNEMVRNGTGRGAGQEYLTGFRSPTYLIEPTEIEEGWVSETDFKFLLKYAEMWEELVKAHGVSGPYINGNGAKRMWLAPANEKFIFKFDLCDRLNPQTQDLVFGIDNISWANTLVRGYGVTAIPSKTSKATGKVKCESSEDVFDIPEPQNFEVNWEESVDFADEEEEMPAPPRRRS